jgi:hypothetical protein
MMPTMVNLLAEAVGQPPRLRPRLTVIFAPRRLAWSPRLTSFAHHDIDSCSSVYVCNMLSVQHLVAAWANLGRRRDKLAWWKRPR